jgi:hypothetical protein
MKYVTPGNVEPMSTHHARMLMVWYGKDDLTMGLHMCDVHMCDVVLAQLVKKDLFMGKLRNQRRHAVEAFVAAHALGLPETTAAGTQQTKRVLAGFNTICRTTPAQLDSGGARTTTGSNPDCDIRITRWRLLLQLLPATAQPDQEILALSDHPVIALDSWRWRRHSSTFPPGGY